MNTELIDIILNFEKQLNEIIFEEMLREENLDKALAAKQMKEHLSKIKELVNKELDVEIKQKL